MNEGHWGAKAASPPSKVAKKGNMRPWAKNGEQALASLPRACVLRIEQELRELFREPVPFIHVETNEENILRLDALIIGPLDTPYAGGFFHFEVVISAEYPHKPPRVTLRTTDGGRVRFNPNLYACGKVCLSILGTWNGPAWSSACSLSSMLLSIQSLMSPKPYHNEPGYENHKDPVPIENYNDMIEHQVLRVAVCGMLENPTCNSAFSTNMERHFLMWYKMYEDFAKTRQHLNGNHFKDPFKEGTGVFDYQTILARLEATRERLLAAIEEDSKMTDADVASHPKGRNALLAINRELGVVESFAAASVSTRTGSPMVWDIVVFGPEGSPYEGGIYSAEFIFSVDFPEKPPFIRFTSNMFHPNISLDGYPMIESVQTRWRSSSSLSKALEEIVALLTEPCLTYPINQEATRLFREDSRKYSREVRRRVLE